jgi:hypothetical protein
MSGQQSNDELRKKIEFFKVRHEQILGTREQRISRINEETCAELDDIEFQISQCEEEILINSIVQHCLTGK